MFILYDIMKNILRKSYTMGKHTIPFHPKIASSNTMGKHNPIPS